MSVFYNRRTVIGNIFVTDFCTINRKIRNMADNVLHQRTKDHLNILCSEITDRRVGGEGNRKATEYLKKVFSGSGWETEETLLSVMDWRTDGATLSCGEKSFEIFSSLYSLGCSVKGELVPVNSFEELRKADISGKIAFLHGAIASEQIMPKNFVFYNPEEHQQVISVLEQAKPEAIICATASDGATAGGVYPFPMFEDGDFNIPSVYMKDTEGEKLLPYAGKIVDLNSKALRIPSTAFNIVARKGEKNKKRIVVSAHVDAKIGTSGAIDNATGVTVLLLLSELIKHCDGDYCIELVAFNGEDYYAVPGQMKYIEQNEGLFDSISLNINIDGVGFKEGPSCFSSFDLPEKIAERLAGIIQNHPYIVHGQPWVQGDHSIFIQYGCPAIAVSSNWFIENFTTQNITHTPLDNLSIVNFDRVLESAMAIKDLILSI